MHDYFFIFYWNGLQTLSTAVDTWLYIKAKIHIEVLHSRTFIFWLVLAFCTCWERVAAVEYCDSSQSNQQQLVHGCLLYVLSNAIPLCVVWVSLVSRCYSCMRGMGKSGIPMLFLYAWYGYPDVIPVCVVWVSLVSRCYSFMRGMGIPMLFLLAWYG